MTQCPDKLANRADSTQEMIAEIERLREALVQIIDRSGNGELGTSKVIDMAKTAREALSS